MVRHIKVIRNEHTNLSGWVIIDGNGLEVKYRFHTFWGWVKLQKAHKQNWIG